MEWRQIKGFKNYLISDTGLVKSLFKNRILKESDNGRGYKKIGIFSDKGYTKQVYIHRLVALNFIPNPKNKRTVNHKNGIKSDNRLENLEWSTDSENNKHSYEKLNRTTLKNNPKVSKSVCKLDNNGKILEIYPSTREADRANNISGVYRVCKGERKTAGGYRWEYQEKV